MSAPLDTLLAEHGGWIGRIPEVGGLIGAECICGHRLPDDTPAAEEHLRHFAQETASLVAEAVEASVLAKYGSTPMRRGMSHAAQIAREVVR